MPKLSIMGQEVDQNAINLSINYYACAADFPKPSIPICWYYACAASRILRLQTPSILNQCHQPRDKTQVELNICPNLVHPQK